MYGNKELPKEIKFFDRIEKECFISEKKKVEDSSPSDRFSKALLRIAGTQPTGAPTSDSHPILELRPPHQGAAQSGPFTPGRRGEGGAEVRTGPVGSAGRARA